MASSTAWVSSALCSSIFPLVKEHNKKAFLSYAWGVWTSAYCRAELQKFIKIVGDDFIYCDTDGIFFINEKEHIKEIKKLIDATEAAAEKINISAVDNDGVIHFMGAWEKQENIKAFASAGIKKYAWQDSKGLHIATAGVNKELGGLELGKIENYKEGFKFKEAGGNEAIYYDEAAGEIEIKGRKIEITPFVILRPREFTLGVYQEFKNLLSYPEFWLDYISDRGHNSNEYIFK